MMINNCCSWVCVYCSPLCRSLEDLWTRYETPDEKNRWDAPLFRVDDADVSELCDAMRAAAGAAEATAAAAHAGPAGGAGPGAGPAEGAAKAAAAAVPAVCAPAGDEDSPASSAAGPLEPCTRACDAEPRSLASDTARSAACCAGAGGLGALPLDTRAASSDSTTAPPASGGSGSASDAGGASSTGVPPPPTAASIPVFRAIAAALFAKPGLRPVLSTMQTATAAPNFLHELDRTTTAIVGHLSGMLGLAVAGDVLRVPGSTAPVVLARKVPVVELRRLKRVFDKQAAAAPMPLDAVGRQFVEFINGNLR